MGEYRVPPHDINDVIKKLKKQIQSLVNTQATPVFTTATRPAASQVMPGKIIYVSDGGAGNVFQGWNGSSWVSLG